MSIATRTGDDGTTGLLFGGRVPKSHPRVEAYGCVDELNSTIGMARAYCATDPWLQKHLRTIQEFLIPLMGELAVDPSHLDRYQLSKLPKLDEKPLALLDDLVEELEHQNLCFNGWATPGDNLASASLDLARTTCRRAERALVRLSDLNQAPRPLIFSVLNRLSDVLWLMARRTETPHVATTSKDKIQFKNP